MLLHNVSLKPYNTFGIDATAARFMPLTAIEQLAALPSAPPYYLLGGGSNILLTQNIGEDKIVIHNQLKGITTVAEDSESVVINVVAGENWHQWVCHAIDKGWCGIENLALIPGTVGAAPIQNIGAYGCEVADVIESVFYWNFNTQSIESLTAADCQFGYRYSVFKRMPADNKVLITSVNFKLYKNKQPNVSYNALTDYFKAHQVDSPTVRQVADAVIAIRQSKLPNPAITGNAGSFFKNPVISLAHYQRLIAHYPNMPAYPSAEQMKVPAGWLIETIGYKGYKKGNAGVHSKQALVLVNYGGATGAELLSLAKEIQQKVYAQFEIALETEVQIW
ncbi:MAG: UDP-N-acetylmuramate dehydrogenase [Chitinophagia bacterium]|nr:UDP-N-acetylmuramate dehydrogenase [Chitinophagia bacterium]